METIDEVSLHDLEEVEKRGQREYLIETKYVGTYEKLVGTKGEAFFNLHSNSWHYRPFGWDYSLEVTPEEIDCANDSGWVRGSYLGQKNIGKFGKARWSEVNDGWLYRPKGKKEEYAIPENDFQMVRDEDY